MSLAVQLEGHYNGHMPHALPLEEQCHGHMLLAVLPKKDSDSEHRYAVCGTLRRTVTTDISCMQYRKKDSDIGHMPQAVP
jgi:hypothetical protein